MRHVLNRPPCRVIHDQSCCLNLLRIQLCGYALYYALLAGGLYLNRPACVCVVHGCNINSKYLKMQI